MDCHRRWAREGSRRCGNWWGGLGGAGWGGLRGPAYGARNRMHTHARTCAALLPCPPACLPVPSAPDARPLLPGAATAKLAVQAACSVQQAWLSCPPRRRLTGPAPPRPTRRTPRSCGATPSPSSSSHRGAARQKQRTLGRLRWAVPDAWGRWVGMCGFVSVPCNVRLVRQARAPLGAGLGGVTAAGARDEVPGRLRYGKEVGGTRRSFCAPVVSS